MGTNFYLRQKITKSLKDELHKYIDENNWEDLVEHIPKEIHIGKRSYGWKFLWNAHNFKYFNPSKESLIEWLKSGQIVNEYGKMLSFEEFWREIEDFLGGLDLKKYYNQSSNIKNPFFSSSSIKKFEDYGVFPNQYGEFYIENLRFCIHEDFC